MRRLLGVVGLLRQQQLHGEVPVAGQLHDFPDLAGLAGVHAFEQTVTADILSAMPLPVFLEVDVSFHFELGLVHLEAAFFQQLDDAERRAGRCGAPVSWLFWGTPIMMGLPHRNTCVRAGSSDGSQLEFQLTAGNEVLNVNLVAARATPRGWSAANRCSWYSAASIPGGSAGRPGRC